MPTGVASWSKTPATNATADSGVAWPEGQAPSTVNDSARGMMASTAKWRDDISGGLTTGGTSTAYTVTTNQVFASLAALDKLLITIVPNVTSGLNPTLAVDGLAAKQIRSATGVNVPTGALAAGTAYALVYFNATTEFILLGAVAAVTTLAGLDITGATALTAPDVADQAAVFDVSAAANRKITLADLFKVINTITAVTAPATNDVLSIFDTSGAVAGSMSFADFLKVIDALTGKTTPVAADEFLIYDVAGAAAKKVTLANLQTTLGAIGFTSQYLLAGSSATYTTPANCRALRIKMIGGGGGGGGSGSGGAFGSNGGTTSFNFIDASGGAGGGGTFQLGGAGGSGGAGAASLRLPGSAGDAAQNGADSAVAGSSGAPGIFGTGGGQGTLTNSIAGGANTGAGGAGGGGNNTGAGGGAGEYVEIVIASPAASYIYSIGGGGSGNTSGNDGGAGGSGIIIVEEYY